ncbi:MFS transporter, partial [Rhizobium ruizarguesonis]
MSEIAANISVDSRNSIYSQDEELPSAMTVALVQLALACGGFGIGTGEFAIMGLLPNVAETFTVTTPQAGYVISAYALGVVVGAPVIA